jgi:haloalkane dehalogenase
MNKIFITIVMTASMTQLKSQELYPAWLDRNEYPFKSNYLKLDMGDMHYIDEGMGEPIVMVHGNPGWSFEFRNIIKEMSKTHRCIAPDHIGFGLSDKPVSWDYLPASHATNLEILLDSLQLNNITLVVNDWGGPIGLNYAIKHPEKIKRLIVLNSWLWSVEDDAHFKRFSTLMGGTVGRFLIKRFNFFGKHVVKKAMGDKRKLSKRIHEHYFLHMENAQSRKGCYVFPQQIVGSSFWLESLWQQRAKINAIQTSFIWGMKDIAFRPEELNYWLNHWKNPTVIRLPDVGHFPQEEMPEEIIKELKRKD